MGLPLCKVCNIFGTEIIPQTSGRLVFLVSYVMSLSYVCLYNRVTMNVDHVRKAIWVHPSMAATLTTIVSVAITLAVSMLLVFMLVQELTDVW